MKYYAGNFIADDGTKFLIGPWFSNGNRYDYKLIENPKDIYNQRDNTDYCTEEQMLDWGVKIVKILKD